MIQPTHPGRLVATAAILVSAPRLSLAFLVADGVTLPQSVHVFLLALSSLATAVAVTGGAAYLAHTAVTATTGRRTLGLIWLAALLASSALMAPLIVEGLARSPLAATLATPAIRWAWAVCAVLAVDLVAAGAMRAEAGASRDREQLEQEHGRALNELREQRDRARADLQGAQAFATSRGTVPPDASDNPAFAPTPPPIPRRISRRAPLTSGDIPGAFACPCRRAFTTQQALAGHQRWCPVARDTGIPSPAAGAAHTLVSDGASSDDRGMQSSSAHHF